ncbi:flavodoxin [Odoribacteraceae bacterium]|nr:flavodoxin [Odoribacteraceae bacterium]GKH92416.1 flavodoxin [Odoribacteraceae bacterium]GKH97034.1 flavodoxin [Odoribacteraceae bacterium]GKI03913.1 flavodoxin [Odoribacteraceae bacterium]
MNKKNFLPFLFMLLCVATTVTACGKESQPSETNPEETITGNAGKTLIVYFSWGGNTRTVANHIHNLIGGDIVEIETVVPYPDTYEQVTQIVPGQLESDYRPELKTKVENMDEYDTLIVGTPIWGGHLAPPVKSFLAGYNLAGKFIAPFCTHGGSGTAQSVSDIRSVCSDVTILKSLAVYGNRAGNARGEIEQWLKQIGIIR